MGEQRKNQLKWANITNLCLALTSPTRWLLIIPLQKRQSGGTRKYFFIYWNGMVYISWCGMRTIYSKSIVTQNNLAEFPREYNKFKMIYNRWDWQRLQAGERKKTTYSLLQTVQCLNLDNGQNSYNWLRTQNAIKFSWYAEFALKTKYRSKRAIAVKVVWTSHLFAQVALNYGIWLEMKLEDVFTVSAFIWINLFFMCFFISFLRLILKLKRSQNNGVLFFIKKKWGCGEQNRRISL